MNATLMDIRYAVRAFVRTPGFTAAAIASVAIGIGVNAAIFSVASALLLRPLPYRDADRLVIVWNRSPGLGITEDWFSTAQYFDIKNGHGGFEQVAIAIGNNENLTGDGEPERIGTIRMSSNLLPMLGVRAEVGRLFTADEDVRGARATALLGYGTWMRRYGGDRRAIGRSLVLNGVSYEIVGVLPERFSLPREVMPTLGLAEDAEVVLPMLLAPDAASIRTREDYNIIGKLKPGVSVAQAQSEMDALTARLRRAFPEVYPPNGGLTFGIVPLREQVVGDVRRAVLLLAGAVGFVLLIACANVANLLLGRALARQKEIAVRSALGAGRARLVRQLLTESLLLALAGGVAGLVLAAWTVHGIHVLGARSLPRLPEIGVDGRVLFFTFIVSIVSGVVFGLAPAVRLARADLHGQLKDAGRGAASAGLWGRGQVLRRLLVVSELALSVVLLVGAGLLVRSFARLQRVEPGFNRTNVLTLELTMSGRKYNDGPSVLEAYRQLWSRLAALPGVTAAGGVSALPLSQMMSWGPITVEGRTPPPGEKFINADQRIVGGDYFRAMEIPLLDGRVFDDRDVRSAPRVAVIDAHMAQQLWPGGPAVGKRLRLGNADSQSPWLTVIGVVGRVKQDTLETDPRIALYLAHTQYTARAMNVVVHSGVEPLSLSTAVRRQIRELDSDLPVYNVRTMEARVGESLARRRFSMLLLTLFAGIALTLAIIGTYGVMAYLVHHSTRELAIRMALGASPGGLLLMVVRQGALVALAGIALGLAGAFVVTRFMRALLFGVEATDPATFVQIAVLLAVVTLVASYVPARRAARVDPMISLRAE